MAKYRPLDGHGADMSGYTLHFSMTKAYLLELIIELGAQAVMKDFDGTDEEAYASVQADPRECFTFCPCDNQAPNGSCRGHKSASSEAAK